ncbi:hypothetical protein FJZ17_03320 [Candidatus Pacearchaeota archaeon]|nr:hypothetical protein [Candidatus Pacearchaeota archaeon]
MNKENKILFLVLLLGILFLTILFIIGEAIKEYIIFGLIALLFFLTLIILKLYLNIQHNIDKSRLSIKKRIVTITEEFDILKRSITNLTESVLDYMEIINSSKSLEEKIKKRPRTTL